MCVFMVRAATSRKQIIYQSLCWKQLEMFWAGRSLRQAAQLHLGLLD
jgi:hypothetical protein